MQPYLSINELEHRYRTAKEPNERTWWQILWLLAQGRTATEVSAVIGYRAYWIGQIAKRYNELGPGGMRNRRHTTSYRPAPVLSAEQQQELQELQAAFSQAAAQNQHWTGTDVAAWMSQRLGRPVSYGLGWSYLVKLKHSLQAPRPRHALADAEEQETFKKTPTARECTGHGLFAFQVELRCAL
ncbi:MAG: winged helix-turn-helix domain-containing protein [Ktedonobacterales bacterium]